MFPRASMAGCASDLLALVPAPQRFAVAGLSMGGYVALAAARAAPERLAGLALVNSQCRADSPEARARRLAQLAAVAAGGGRLGAVRAAQAALLLHPARLPADVPAAVAALEAEEAAAFAGAVAGGGGAAIAAAGAGGAGAFEAFVRGALRVGSAAFEQQQCSIMSREDTGAVLGELAARRVPMCALTGSHDALIPPAVGRALHALMGASGAPRGAGVIEGCGHLSALEAPEEVAEHLLEWLARVDAAEGAAGGSGRAPCHAHSR